MLTLNDGRNELWQWDTGRKLKVDADCSQVHFSNKVFGRSVDMDVVDGVANIPDILLQTDKDLIAWAFVGTVENGYTKISKVFKVNRRNKPADYVFTPSEQTTLAEIMERLDGLESIQDPDAIKNAVDDYLSNNPIQIKEEDPTVPDWAKQPKKPTYTAKEVGSVSTVNGVSPDENGNVEITIPDSGGNVDLAGYATEQWVQDQKYLTAVPDGYAKTADIPTKVSELDNDSGYLTEHQSLDGYALKSEIPSVPVQSVNGKTGAVKLSAFDVGALPENYTPPNQTAEQVGADQKGTATSAVSQHNTADDSHGDIRLELKAINDRLTAFFDSDDQTLDELSEIVAYITSNKSLIDSITTSKVSVADIVNNLTTNVTNKPLSAAQGVVLKGLIDTVCNSLSSYALKSEIPSWAMNSSKPSYSKSEVGLGNVENVKQYSATNPPPYPVTSVNGKTGAVTLDASAVDARPSNWMPTAAQVGADPDGTAANAVSAHNQSDASHADIRESVRQLSENKANKQGLSLGVGSDGLVYLFVDGTAQGNGLDINAEAVAGDVVGYVDENNTIILTGALADGTYVLKYENEDGVQTEIGALDVGNVVKDIPLTWALGTKLDKTTGKVTETGSTTYAATQYIDIVSGKTYTIRRNSTALTYTGCSICWYNASDTMVSYTENFFGTGDADTKTEYIATVPSGATKLRLRMFYNGKGSTMATVAAGYSMTQG